MRSLGKRNDSQKFSRRDVELNCADLISKKLYLINRYRITLFYDYIPTTATWD